MPPTKPLIQHVEKVTLLRMDMVVDVVTDRVVTKGLWRHDPERTLMAAAERQDSFSLVYSFDGVQC